MNRRYFTCACGDRTVHGALTGCSGDAVQTGGVCSFCAAGHVRAANDVDRRAPHFLTTAEVMRRAAAALRESMPQLAAELAVRAIRIDRFRVEADLDRRRGFVLPLGYLNQIDGAPDPVAAEAFDAWKRSRS